MFKKLWQWLTESKSPKSQVPGNITANIKTSTTAQSIQSDVINQTSIEIHALIEFIEAYEKDNAENLKKEKEIEERFLHKKD